MSFKAIHENKILAKISEFKVCFGWETIIFNYMLSYLDACQKKKQIFFMSSAASGHKLMSAVNAVWQFES